MVVVVVVVERRKKRKRKSRSRGKTATTTSKGRNNLETSHLCLSLLTCSAVSSSFHFSSGVFLSSFSEVAMARMELRRRERGEFDGENLNAAIDDDDDDDVNAR
jgi:hypothetical protein